MLHPDGKRILMIQEKRAFMRGKAIWKFPGGLVDMGETLDQAVIREVMEETGIDTEFVGMLGLREIPDNFRHGQGDLYFPCLL